MNFLAFTNRISDSHLDIIWTSAQLKHCSKPIMNMLMSLHKHLNIDSIKYLASLIAKLELIQHTEQTLLLSALLTKTIWFIVFDSKNKNKNQTANNKSIGLQLKASPPPDNLHSPRKFSRKQTLRYKNLLKEKQLKIKMLNYHKSNKKALISDRIKRSESKPDTNISQINNDETSAQNLDTFRVGVNNNSDFLDEISTNNSSTNSSENEAPETQSKQQGYSKKSKQIWIF